MRTMFIICVMSVMLMGCDSMSDDLGNGDGGRAAPVIQSNEVDPG